MDQRIFHLTLQVLPGAREAVQPTDLVEGLSLGFQDLRRSVADAGRALVAPVSQAQRGAEPEEVGFLYEKYSTYLCIKTGDEKCCTWCAYLYIETSDRS